VIIVIARFRPRSDRRDDLVALLEEVQDASRGDDGCLHYGYFAEIADSMSFIAVEEWRDMEVLEAHLRQPHVSRLVRALPELAQGRPEVQAHEVSRSVPLPLPGATASQPGGG
jgi:quinol monooxygenase YgiN